jgi:signal transduction histidine kinase/ActR/RegA family two-component response regulator
LRAREGEVVSVQRTYRSPGSADPIDLEVTHVAGSVGPDGQQLVYSFGQDITARNLALDALARARDEAERANKAKSQFLSHMSHELRTPMNAIVGFSQLLRRDSRPPLAPHQLGYAQQILQGAEHLLKLINEVLDLGSIEAGRLPVELSPVPVCEVADDSLAFVRELARSHGVHLQPTLELDPADLEPHAQVVLADRTRLRQVMLNLLGNAIKYNRPGGTVKMRCRSDGGQVFIEVLDTGRGIPAAEQQRLFQPFERLGAERGAVEGAGIGLALSRRLVLAMAGHMGLSSEPGVGSTFWLCLPAAAIALPPAPPPAPASLRAELRQTTGASAPATVLYIDDNEVNLMLMESLLEDSAGVRLISSKDPAEGLRLAQQLRPSVVLLDIHMPGMDGYEVLAQMRAHPATAHIPVVAVSADAMQADLDAARSAGFAAYLTKPLDFEQLLRTVDRLSQSGQNAASTAT